MQGLRQVVLGLRIGNGASLTRAKAIFLPQPHCASLLSSAIVAMYSEFEPDLSLFRFARSYRNLVRMPLLAVEPEWPHRRREHARLGG
jgi:hypothetical protein